MPSFFNNDTSWFKMVKLMVTAVLVFIVTTCEGTFDKKQADRTLELVHVVSTNNIK